MKRAHFLIGGTCIVAVLVAQQPETTRFASKKGDFAIENIQKEFFEGSGGSVEFEFSGSPLRGYSRSQALDFEALKAEGSAKSGADKSMFLNEATLSGNVRLWQNKGTADERLLTTASLTMAESGDRSSATVTLPGAFQVKSKSGTDGLSAGSGKIVFSGGAGQTRVMRSASLSGGVMASVSSADGTHRMDSSSVKIDQVSGGTKFTFASDLVSNHQVNGATNRTVSFTAQSGWVSTPDITKRTGKGKRPVTGADLVGPVTIKVVSVSAKDKEPLTITAKGDHLTMDENGVLVLKGNITVESDDLSYARSGTSQELYVNFGPDMEVLKYGSRGAPAKVEIKPKGGGG